MMCYLQLQYMFIIHLYLTQLVVERPGGQESMHPEFEELSCRSRRFVLRVIGEDFLYHETPVAMSSMIRVNFRRIVMRPHVQRMLHNLVLRSPSVRTQAMINPLRGPDRLSYSPGSL